MPTLIMTIWDFWEPLGPDRWMTYWKSLDLRGFLGPRYALGTMHDGRLVSVVRVASTQFSFGVASATYSTICGVWTEPDYRGQGRAKAAIDWVRRIENQVVAHTATPDGSLWEGFRVVASSPVENQSVVGVGVPVGMQPRVHA